LESGAEEWRLEEDLRNTGGRFLELLNSSFDDPMG
jgi:hypothetical protein